MGNVVALIVGFGLLVVGADKFVEGSSAFARKLGIPSLVIGLTIVAFGTSAPELAVSLVAGLKGANEIAIGNVLGSNIFNLLVVVGCSAMVAPLVIEKELLKRDWVGTILSTLLLGGLLLMGKELSRLDALALLVAFAIIMWMQIRSAIHGKTEESKGNSEREKSGIVVGVYIILGLTAIILGGQLSVTGASGIARSLQISETVIGLTVVAIGTSLPELVTSVVATRRGENSIAIGNVIGSNLFNILFILGISALCTPIGIQVTAIYDTVVLLIVSIVLYAFARRGSFHRKYHRALSCGMIAVYIAYTAWILLR